MRTIDCITYLKKGESPDFPVIRDDIGIHEFETEIIEEGFILYGFKRYA